MTDPLASTGPERDGRGRPKIIPLDTDGKPNVDGKLVAYTRASTFAKALSDPGGLTDWKVRHAVVGVSISPDLAAIVGALGTNPDEFTPDQKRDLDDVIERAHDRSGGNVKADYGTAVHTLTEPGNEGVTAAIPEMAGDVNAYQEALNRHGIEVVESEVFVVHDDLKVAGTFDDKYRLTRPLMLEDGSILPADSLLIGDKKTGTLHFDEHAVQLAVYAHADGYDYETGERTAHGALKTYGILAHIGRGTATCDLYLVDLQIGWYAAQLCLQVRAYRSTKTKKSQPLTSIHPYTAIREPADELDAAVDAVQHTFPDAEPTDDVLEAIRICKTHAELKNVWSRYKATWTETHTAASKARMEQIGAGN
uniref:Exonuclease n=1 Tax=uncultured organism TaxID=155900 RepID=A0A7L9QBS7_9ZZZZ|nr:hypothetical protein [uncultured organism]